MPEVDPQLRGHVETQVKAALRIVFKGQEGPTEETNALIDILMQKIGEGKIRVDDVEQTVLDMYSTLDEEPEQ